MPQRGYFATCTGWIEWILQPLELLYFIWGLFWTFVVSPSLVLLGCIYTGLSYTLNFFFSRCQNSLSNPVGGAGGRFLIKFGGYVEKIKSRYPGLKQLSKLIGSILEVTGEAWEVTVKGSTGLLSWAFTMFLGWLFWYLTGTSGLLAPVYINEVSLVLDSIITGFIALGNVFLQLQGWLIFVLNLFRIPLNAISSFLMGVVVSITQSISLVQSAAEQGDRRQGRELSQANAFYSRDETFDVLEQIWNLGLSKFIYTITLIFQVGVLLYSFFSKFGVFLLTFLTVIGVGGLEHAACCSTAPLCCAKTIVRGLILIIGIDIGSCNRGELNNALCICTTAQGGQFKVDASCELPRYSCRFTNGEWVETKTEQLNIDGPLDGKVTETLRGPIQQLVCARSRPTGTVSSQSGGRRTLFEDCVETCIYHHGSSFSITRCGEETFFKGDCDDKGRHRRLEGELWKAHLKKFKKHSDIPITLRAAPPEPQTLNEESSQRITREHFIRKLQEVESKPPPASFLLDGCAPGHGDVGYEDFAWRTACLVIKGLALKLPQGGSLPAKQLSHVWRALKEEHDIHQVLDNLAQTHNEHFPEDELSTNHVKTRRELEGAINTAKRRSTEAVELLKKANIRNLLGESTAEDYRCPGSGEIVKKNELSKCKVPTDEQLLKPGVAIEYGIYLITSWEQQLDVGTLLKNGLSCWITVFNNPSLNPGGIQGIIAALGGKSEDEFVYCFPAFKRLPYPGKLTFSWNQFVQDECKPVPGIDGTIHPCKLSHYSDSLNVINCYDKWTTFAPQCVETRLYDSWLGLQWLITRAPIGWFNSLWATLMQLFGASPSVVNAFSPHAAEGGRSDNLNWFLFWIHIYSLIWLLLFILLPLYLYWAYFWKGTLIILRGVQRGFLSGIYAFLGYCCGCCKFNKSNKGKSEKLANETKELLGLAL